MSLYTKQILSRAQVGNLGLQSIRSRRRFAISSDASKRKIYPNPQQLLTDNNSSFGKGDSGKNTKRKVYKVSSTSGNYENTNENLNYYEDQPRKRIISEAKNYKKERFPEVKQIHYVFKKRINPDKDQYKSIQNFRLPTVNSIMHAEKKNRKNKINDFKKICSVKCVHKRNREKYMKFDYLYSPKIEKIQDPLEIDYSRSKKYFQKSCKHLQNDQKSREIIQITDLPDGLGRSLSDKNYKYIHHQQNSKKFYDLVTCFAKDIFYPKESDIIKQTILRPQDIPRIPEKEELTNFIESYKVKNPMINLQKLLNSPYFMVEYSPNQLYFGEMVKRQKSGKGIFLQQNRCFQGIFKDNKKIKGMEFNSVGIYKGEYYNNKREGNGQFEWFNGQYYVGEWQDGKRHGNGKWINSYGDSYDGSWKNGRGQGYGVYIVNNQKYSGQFQNFKKQGWGTQQFPNGDKFQGNYSDGQPDGKGVYIWSNGSKYQGHFQMGLRHGKGLLILTNGFSYQGEFNQQKPEGLCEIIMPNRDTYKGMLRDGRKNGRGILTLARQRKIFDGYWQDDKFIDSMVY